MPARVHRRAGVARELRSIVVRSESVLAPTRPDAREVADEGDVAMRFARQRWSAASPQWDGGAQHDEFLFVAQFLVNRRQVRSIVARLRRRRSRSLTRAWLHRRAQRRAAQRGSTAVSDPSADAPRMRSTPALNIDCARLALFVKPSLDDFAARFVFGERGFTCPLGVHPVVGDMRSERRIDLGQCRLLSEPLVGFSCQFKGRAVAGQRGEPLVVAVQCSEFRL